MRGPFSATNIAMALSKFPLMMACGAPSCSIKGVPVGATSAEPKVMALWFPGAFRTADTFHFVRGIGFKDAENFNSQVKYMINDKNL